MKNAMEQAAFVAHWEQRVVAAEAALAALTARANMTADEQEALLTARGKAEGALHAAKAWLTRAKNGDDGTQAGGKAKQTKADKRKAAFAAELAALVEPDSNANASGERCNRLSLSRSRKLEHCPPRRRDDARRQDVNRGRRTE